jgi:hypothetical protein
MVGRASGFDGITPRLKVNLVGNDGGNFALALVPYITLPAASASPGNDPVSGGVGAPCSFAISSWQFGAQTRIHLDQNAAGYGYHPEVDNSLAIGHGLSEKLSLWLEFFGSAGTDRGARWIGTVDTWLTWQVSKNWSLDSGIYIGVTPSADSWHPWLGTTRRF